MLFRSEQSATAGSSGGYLYHIMATEQARHPGSTISIQRGRNVDVVDYSLLSTSGETLMKCARYYGFRNIQNLVRKLKPAKQSRLPGAARRMAASTSGGSEYTYVEVMACPGGCTNGGGQIKIDDVASILPQTRGEQVSNVGTAQSQKEWLKRVDEAYYSADSDSESECDGDVVMTNGDGQATHQAINGIDVSEVQTFLDHWASLVGVPLDKLAYTTYREVESDVGKNKASGKNLDDAARIAQIAGMSGGGW